MLLWELIVFMLIELEDPLWSLQHHILNCSPGLNKKGKRSGGKHVFMAVFLQYDQLLQIPTTFMFQTWWTVPSNCETNKSFLPSSICWIRYLLQQQHRLLRWLPSHPLPASKRTHADACFNHSTHLHKVSCSFQNNPINKLLSIKYINMNIQTWVYMIPFKKHIFIKKVINYLLPCSICLLLHWSQSLFRKAKEPWVQDLTCPIQECEFQELQEVSE